MSFLVSLLFHFVKFGPHYTLLENNILENILFACVIFIPLCLFTTWLFLKKTFSWQELLFLCHFRCRFITTSTLVESTILGKVLLCFGKICPPAFLNISWECLRCQKKLSRLWIRCLWPLAPDIGLLWQCQYELPAGLHIPKAKVIFPRCASSKYRIWNTSYLFWLI